MPDQAEDGRMGQGDRGLGTPGGQTQQNTGRQEVEQGSSVQSHEPLHFGL